MNKGQFGLLTAALGLATMAGAGYIGYAHADSGHPTSRSGGLGAAALGGEGAGAGLLGVPAGGAAGPAGPAGATGASTATGAASPAWATG